VVFVSGAENWAVFTEALTVATGSPNRQRK
jgi:hypothetical protein